MPEQPMIIRSAPPKEARQTSQYPVRKNVETIVAAPPTTTGKGFSADNEEVDAARQFVLRHGWLSKMPPKFQYDVIVHCLWKKVKVGAFVYQVGDPPGGMYGLVSGSLAIEVAPTDQGPYFASIATPGTWFGERAALTGKPRMVGLRATRPTNLLYLPLHAINAIVAEDPSAWRCLALATTDHLDTAILACDDLRNRDHVTRFLAVLLHLGGCRLATPPNFVEAELDVGHEDLAAMANVARTTAGTILRGLEKAGHIEMAYRRITLRSPDALRLMMA